MYLIKDTCVGCHNCAMECPMQAISYVGRQYQIDQDKCVGCGLCEKLCHSCSIIDTEAPPAVPHDLVEKQCDVLVCGGGTGIIGAVKAAQHGKKVILIEKAKKLGGNSDYAHGFIPIYTKWHEQQGLEDLREKAVSFFLDACDHELEESVIRTAVYGCGEFFDWLCEQDDMHQYFDFLAKPEPGLSLPGTIMIEQSSSNEPASGPPAGGPPAGGPPAGGPPAGGPPAGGPPAGGPPIGEAFEDEAPEGPPPLTYGNAMITQKKREFYNLLCRDDAIGPGWAYSTVKETLLKVIKRDKLDVEILLETAAEHLLLDDEGRVAGVLARDPGGQVKINAKAVILATGGFARSSEKLQKYFRFYDCETVPHCFTVPSDTGDAIDMLEELGVAPDCNHMFIPMHGAPSHHPYSYALNCVVVNNGSVIQINLDGKRWHNEGKMSQFCPEFAQQPKQICWSILDEKSLLYHIQDARTSNPMLARCSWILDYVMDEIEEEMNMPRDVFPGPAVRKANTIRELADDLGIDADTLEAEIIRYNRFCAQGFDEDFHKPPMFLRPIDMDGPFYAVYGQRFIEMAAGGLRVDAQCRILREDHTPIPGLYGVGDATSAMHRQDKYAIISELTWATASSYKSGENASAYIDQMTETGGNGHE